VNEVVPLLGGAVLGYLVGGLRPHKRLVVIAFLSVPVGICASAVTGELSISWEFVLVDIPLVALSAAVGVAAWVARRRAVGGMRLNPRRRNA
jgi:hypothetical protein